MWSPPTFCACSQTQCIRPRLACSLCKASVRRHYSVLYELGNTGRLLMHVVSHFYVVSLLLQTSQHRSLFAWEQWAVFLARRDWTPCPTLQSLFRIAIQGMFLQMKMASCKSKNDKRNNSGEEGGGGLPIHILPMTRPRFLARVFDDQPALHPSGGFVETPPIS